MVAACNLAYVQTRVMQPLHQLAANAMRIIGGDTPCAFSEREDPELAEVAAFRTAGAFRRIVYDARHMPRTAPNRKEATQPGAHERSLVTVSTMAGALVLARAVDKPRLSTRYAKQH
jgi:hypothetical protein